MNNYSRLIIPFSEFKEKADQVISGAQNIHGVKVTTEEELLQLETAKKEWMADASKLLQDSFEEKNNDFYREFLQTPQQFTVGFNQAKKPLHERAKSIKDNVNAKSMYLVFNLKIIAVCDFIRSNDKVDFAQRKKYTVKQKIEFLLKTLYQLSDDNFYPADVLLEGNGIPVNNRDEIQQLLDMLENSGLILTHSAIGSQTVTSITAPGRMQVEERLTPYHENYEEIPGNKEVVNQAIEEIKEHLNKLGLGQEILFNELEELKNLYVTLNKKNWGQLVKGKLVDLALGKLVENDTLNYIYHSLTGHDFHLLH